MNRNVHSTQTLAGTAEMRPDPCSLYMGRSAYQRGGPGALVLKSRFSTGGSKTDVRSAAPQQQSKSERAVRDVFVLAWGEDKFYQHSQAYIAL